MVIAKRLSLVLILCAYDLGLGPNATPPPAHKGELLDPALALPVPFCFQGFFPPPETSLRVFVQAVPCLFLLACATTALCTK